MRAHVHHGTREAPARLADLGDGLWQLRLEQPLLARAGDRVVVRSIAPPDTLGGGVVLDPPRAATAGAPTPSRAWSACAAASRSPSREPPAAAGAAGRRRRRPRRCSDSALALEERLRAAGHEPPNAADLDPDDLAALREAGRAVRVGRAMYAHPEALARVRARVEAAHRRRRRDHAGRACATSWRPRASSPRRCSSTSTPSGSPSACPTTRACCAAEHVKKRARYRPSWR